jgi:hypothetical protein
LLRPRPWQAGVILKVGGTFLKRVNGSILMLLKM